jgi:cytochrome c oxidase assembly protein subunit 19
MNVPTLKTLKPRPPEKGSFPLDRDNLCGTFMRTYLRCMKEHDYHGLDCRQFSKDYIKCRMEKGLMEQENLKQLGFEES